MWVIVGFVCLLVIGGIAAEAIPSLMGDTIADRCAIRRPAFWFLLVIIVGVGVFIVLVLTKSIDF